MDLAAINKKIKDVKKELGQYELNETSCARDPFEQFLNWFSDILQTEGNTPSAMVLATVDEQGFPDTRVVLLKELAVHRFIFYSNYLSHKAQQLEKNNVAALNFYWPDYVRQVRIRGRIEKIPRAESETYFTSRPRETQLGAYASVQSSILNSRKEMEEKLKTATEQFSGKSIPCPDHWGGYALIPFEYEFFQGRLWRLHDRLHYTLHDHQWKIERLSP